MKPNFRIPGLNNQDFNRKDPTQETPVGRGAHNLPQWFKKVGKSVANLGTFL